MQTGRRPDQIDQATQVAERVRKLEVMRNTLPYKPREWQNKETLLHLAAELVFLQSHWLQTTATSSQPNYPDNSVSRQAQQVYDLMMTDGYGDHGSAWQWTRVLLACGAIYHPPTAQSWSGSNPLPDPHPPLAGYAPGESVETMSPFLSTADARQVSEPAFDWYDRDSTRLCIWSGMGADGRWDFAGADFNVGGQAPNMPLMPHGEVLTINGVDVHRDGHWLYTEIDPIKWTGTDTTYYMSGGEQQPCHTFGPPQPAMNAHNPGGQPVEGTYNTACVNHPLGGSASGGVLTGAYVILPETDISLEAPPFPWTGQATSAITTILVDIPSAPAWPTLIEMVENALEHFPGVTDWIDARKNLQPQRKQWHRFYRHPRAQGWVEAQVRDREVVLRGTLRLLGDNIPSGALLWYDDRQIPPPARIGSSYYLKVRATHTGADYGAAILQIAVPPGTDVPQGHAGAITIPSLALLPVEGWTTPADSDYELILHFDGARWPTDTTLY